MKKVILPLFLVFVVASGISSCAKCAICKKDDEKYKLCTKDADDKKEIDDVIDSYEDAGWKCRSSVEAF